jgi:beta-lactam-binding protein with PASTA domain
MAGRARRPVQVPDLTGMDSFEASGLLRELHLETGLVRLKPSREQDTGVVIDQDPPAQSLIERGSKVDLTVSSYKLL